MLQLSDQQIDQAFTLILLWFTAGAVLDAHNHVHGAPITFFTAEHAIAYTAVMAFTGLIALLLYRGWKHDGTFRDSLPDGYWLTLLSIPLFTLGGLGDMGWHRVFGFEVQSQQMLSPSHLLLGMGALFLITGPLRRAWYIDEPPQPTWNQQLPLITSTALLVSMFSFMILHFHPFTYPASAAWLGLASTSWALLGIAGIMLHTIFLMIILLRVIDRFDLVPGAFTFILTLNAVIMTVITAEYLFIFPAILTGIITDLLYTALQPSSEQPWRLRLFSALVPGILFSLYFLAIILYGSLAWSIHVWTGTIVMAAAVGVLASIVILPSARTMA